MEWNSVSAWRAAGREEGLAVEVVSQEEQRFILAVKLQGNLIGFTSNPRLFFFFFFFFLQ